MNRDSSLERAIRWPMLALALVGVLIATAFVLDELPTRTARELALTIGAPALWLLLPAAAVWLVVAVVVHAWRRWRRGL